MSSHNRNIKDLIAIEWAEIDRCLQQLKESRSEKLKIRWSRLLATHIERLDKMLWKAGVGKLDENDLAKLLTKIPERYRKIMERKVRYAAKRKTRET